VAVNGMQLISEKVHEFAVTGSENVGAGTLVLSDE
jgi:hypothetical protein